MFKLLFSRTKPDHIKNKRLRILISMGTLDKFPFKAMRKIKNAFVNPETELAVFDLQIYSNACFSDTYEVTEIMAYLMAFGQVKNVNDGWIRTHELAEKPNEPWRVFFLKDMLAIIKTLDPVIIKTEEQIVNDSKVAIDTVKELLPFLSVLTDHGFIVSSSSASNEKFKLVSFEKTQII